MKVDKIPNDEKEPLKVNPKDVKGTDDEVVIEMGSKSQSKSFSGSKENQGFNILEDDPIDAEINEEASDKYEKEKEEREEKINEEKREKEKEKEEERKGSEHDEEFDWNLIGKTLMKVFDEVFFSTIEGVSPNSKFRRVSDSTIDQMGTLIGLMIKRKLSKLTIKDLFYVLMIMTYGVNLLILIKDLMFPRKKSNQSENNSGENKKESDSDGWSKVDKNKPNETEIEEAEVVEVL